MRVLVLSNLFPPDWMGGYELGCAQMCRALADSGNEVRVLTTSKNFKVSDPLSGARTGPFPRDIVVDRALVLSDVYRATEYASEIPRASQIMARAYSRHNMMILADRIASFRPDVVYLFNLFGLGRSAYGRLQE
jgi:glycogen synthase